MWWVGWLAPKISMSSPGFLKMVHQLRLMMFSLKMVDYSMSLLWLSTRVAYRILVSAQVPFGLDWGWNWVGTSLGLGLGGLGTRGTRVWD